MVTSVYLTFMCSFVIIYGRGGGGVKGGGDIEFECKQLELG